jgi:hypothetical protein
MVDHMMDSPEDSEQSSPAQKPGLRLSDLYPAKALITTSIGPIYVRKVNGGDWKAITGEEVHELGVKGLMLLCSREEDKRNFSPLADEEFQTLTEEDKNKLAISICTLNGWDEVSTGDVLAGIGQRLNKARQEKRDSDAKAMKALRKSIESSYSFLSSGALSTLQGQMADLSTLRNQYYAVDALKSSADAQAEMRKTIAPKPSLMSQLDPDPVHIRFPSFENTPVGRATAEGIRVSKETSDKVRDLVEIVAGLNSTIVSKVLPEWFKQVEKSQQDSDTAGRQAAKGLALAAWAIVISAVLTIFVTVWQIHVAKDLDQQNGVQQKQTEALLRQQIAIQTQQLAQQAADAAAMRKAIAEWKPPAPKPALKNEVRPRVKSTK